VGAQPGRARCSRVAGSSTRSKRTYSGHEPGPFRVQDEQPPALVEPAAFAVASNTTELRAAASAIRPPAMPSGGRDSQPTDRLNPTRRAGSPPYVADVADSATSKLESVDCGRCRIGARERTRLLPVCSSAQSLIDSAKPTTTVLVVPCSNPTHNFEVYAIGHGGWGHRTPPAGPRSFAIARSVCLSTFQRLTGHPLHLPYGWSASWPGPGAETARYATPRLERPRPPRTTAWSCPCQGIPEGIALAETRGR
jgi:hypothetical protein